MLNPTVRGKQSWWLALSLTLGLLTWPAVEASAATYSTVFAFDLHVTSAGVVEGDGPNQGLLFGTTSDTTLSYGGTIFRVPVTGGAPQVVYQLQSTDGYSPQAALLRSTDHFLYGTTHFGPRIGAITSAGFGTIFRVAQDGSGFTTLYTFNGASDGAFPDRALVEDATYLYGVATAGGVNGTGSVFRLRKADGLFAVLHSFAPIAATGASTNVVAGVGEGASPSASLLLADDGRLYGVTLAGGANLQTVASGTSTATQGTGTLYSLNTDGSDFRTVYNFTALDSTQTISTNQDGARPNGALLQVASGVLVGTTTTGGDPASGTVTGFGTVFRFDTATASLNTLHAFDNTAGAIPAGSLVLNGANGLVYGVTTSGSSSASPVTQFGNIFSIDPTTATFVNEHPLTFAEGTGLTGGLILASNGDLFGTVASGNACTVLNASGYGAVFRYSFSNAISSGYASCTQPTNNGGGGALSPGMLWLLAILGLVPLQRRWWV